MATEISDFPRKIIAVVVLPLDTRGKSAVGIDLCLRLELVKISLSCVPADQREDCRGQL